MAYNYEDGARIAGVNEEIIQKIKAEFKEDYGLSMEEVRQKY